MNTEIIETETHIFIIEDELRYKIVCVYQEEEDDDYYEEVLSWNGKEYFTTEEEGRSAMKDVWTNWSSSAEDLRYMELFAYDFITDDDGYEDITDEWKIDDYDNIDAWTANKDRDRDSFNLRGCDGCGEGKDENNKCYTYDDLIETEDGYMCKDCK